MSDFVNIVNNDLGQQVNFVDSRYYTKDNEHWYPGVTTILNVLSKGKQYENWLKSNGFNADYLAKIAMEQGSRVHEAIQRLNLGEEIKYGDAEKAFYSRDEWVMISRYVDFFTAFKPEIVAVEKVLVSDKLEYGSQLDLVMKLNDALCIVDHKTGSVYEEAYMQVASYFPLWNEYFPHTPVTKGYILHLEAQTRGRDKAGKSIQGQGWKLIEIEDIDKHLSDFQHVHAIWKRKNENFKPFNLQYPASYKLSINNQNQQQ